jgi:hypothetical protein
LTSKSHARNETNSKNDSNDHSVGSSTRFAIPPDRAWWLEGGGTSDRGGGQRKHVCEVGRFVDDPIALDLIHQYADRMMCDGGPYVSRRFTRRFQVLRFGETLMAKRQTLRPLSNSDSDVRDYSGDGMKSSGSSIVTFSVMGTVQPDQTIHLRLSIWLRILDQPTSRRLFRQVRLLFKLLSSEKND